MIPVRFSRLALADLEDIAAYIASDNPAAAARVINRIEELCFALGHMPGLGRPSEIPQRPKAPRAGMALQGHL
ncbi:MAG: type II toxin-antitoxin system RelE/ParE family toxin [Hyphomicrobiales bacterium]|nr:MAG: type II toxin-antitoxin system RelE/ParE family toxin [Hyphomicrobiales bacterium]